MRVSIAILVAGLALLAAGVREAAGPEASLDAPARKDAADAVRLFAAMSAHMRASNADRRFAERIAADPPVVDEILADIAFVQHAGREEHPRLVDFKVTLLRAAGPDVAELRAREYWVTRSKGPDGEAVRSDVTPVRYALRREGGSWRIADWALDLDDETASGRTLR